MKLGVISDGVSRDPDVAFPKIAEAGLRHVQLQYIWDKEIGDQSPAQLARVRALARDYDISVSCITKHTFSGVDVMTMDVGSAIYQEHIAQLRRSIEAARYLSAPYVRVMTASKRAILWGSAGAEEWVADNSAWGRLLAMYREPLRIAEDSGVILVSETANNGMVTSGWLGKKLIDDLGSPYMKAMWDPANSIVGGDVPFPDGYDALRNDLADIHIKDVRWDAARSTVEFCRLGTGDMAPYLTKIAAALREASYPGVVTLESVYRPENGTPGDGFSESLPLFKEIFGEAVA